MTKLLLAIFVAVVMGVGTVWAGEATEVEVAPVVLESINFQYGDAQFGWQRIRTDRFQVETNAQGDWRFGVRKDLSPGVHGRLLAKLSGGNLTEVRPELILYQGDWYTFISAGIDTADGTVTLYDETVWDFVVQPDWRGGVAVVHNGGLSGQGSTVNVGPHLVVDFTERLSLDVHYGWPITKNTTDEAWAIVKITL